MINLIDKTIF